MASIPGARVSSWRAATVALMGEIRRGKDCLGAV